MVSPPFTVGFSSVALKLETFLHFSLIFAIHKYKGQKVADALQLLAKPAIIKRMHFSRHISQLHSTFSLLAALKLRFAR